MVRSARFAFDDPRGPDHRAINDSFDERDDPLFEAPLSASDDLSSATGRGETTPPSDTRHDRARRPDRAA